MSNTMALLISDIEARLNKELTVVERLRQAMALAQINDVNWLGLPENEQFGCAVAAVFMTATDEERAVIKEELDFLKALSAAEKGVPINIEALMEDKHPIKWYRLRKIWNESKRIRNGKEG